jgi:hypothetical protein
VDNSTLGWRCQFASSSFFPCAEVLNYVGDTNIQ